MKITWRILTLATLLVGCSAPARPVHIPDLRELDAYADLVAIIEPVATTRASDQLFSAGPKYGPRDPKDYQGLNTQFKVLLVLKSSPTLPGGKALESLTLLHFYYTGGPEFNGGMFAYFNLPPTLLTTAASHRPGTKIAESTPVYMAFLKWNKDGRFRPATGDYDLALSFRILTTPYPANASWYAADGILTRNGGTDQPVERTGKESSTSSTTLPPDRNRVEASDGSNRFFLGATIISRTNVAATNMTIGVRTRGSSEGGGSASKGD